MDRLKIAQYIALVGTAFTVIGFIANTKGSQWAAILMGIGMVIGLVSYVFGGFLTALKMAGKIATIGWFIVPFPIDILTFIITLFMSFIIFMYLPIIPIRKAYKESLKG